MIPTYVRSEVSRPSISPLLFREPLLDLIITSHCILDNTLIKLVKIEAVRRQRKFLHMGFISVAVPVLRKLRRVIEDDDDHTQGGSLLLQLSCLLLLFLLFAPGGWWFLLLFRSSLLQAAASKRGRRR